MDQLLSRARKVQEWSNPPILAACITVAGADSEQGERLAAFLSELPGKQLKPAIVPRIAGETWGRGVLERWSVATDVSGPLKRAIASELEGRT
jgi:predicted KAP-like P-loop ATPase